MRKCFWFCLYAALLIVANSPAIAQSTNNQPPVVTWLSPANGATFVAGSTIVLRARAVDTNGAVSFVEFFANSTNQAINLGRGTALSNNIYQLAWSNAPAGNFRLHAEAVDNDGGRGVSGSVQIVVGGSNQPPTRPTITSQPQSQTVSEGSDVTFSVTATGTQPLSYRWRKNGVPIPAATSSALTLSNVTMADEGTYSVIVSNIAGSTTSSNAALTVIPGGTNNTPPVVQWLQPPNGTNFPVGFPIRLVARATDSNGTVNGVEFYANSNLLGTATTATGSGNSTFIWSNAPAGTFRLHAEAVDNLGARGVSGSVVITVGGGTNQPPTPPSITSQPQSQTVAEGSDVTFSVTATGTQPLSYRWRKNGVAIPGATSSTLTLSDVTIADEGTYSVIVSNIVGSALSSNAVLTIIRSGTNNAGPLQIVGRGTTGPGGWDLTVLAQASSNGVSGHISFAGGAEGPVTQLVPPGNNACNCWCINARRTDTEPGSDQRINVYIRDVGDGATSFDQFSWVTGIGIDCTFPTDGLHFLTIIEGDFQSSQGENVAPMITWLQPGSGAIFTAGSTIVMTARATDSDGSVSFVDFFANSTHVGRVAGSSSNNVYRFVWSNPPEGHHQLHAVAVDHAGGRGISESVRIFVGSANPHPVDLGNVQVSSIGHSFVTRPPLPGHPPMPGSVVDYLIDQDQSSGGGALLPSVSVNWDTNSQFRLTVSAPPGHKFLVDVPAGRAVGFGGFLWWESTRGGNSPQGSVTVSFGGLEGTPPSAFSSEAVLSDSHGFFGFADVSSSTTTADFAFTSITLIGTVTPQFTGNGTEHYIPHLESSMLLYYSTPDATDPGPFVSIVPTAGEPPAPCDTIAVLIQQIAQSPHSHRIKRPLIRSLETACEAFEAGRTDRGIAQLEAFQHKVAVQLGRLDSALAELLIDGAQAIIDAIRAD